MNDVRGAVTIEFAYLVPLIVFIFISVFEVSRLIAAERRFSQTTSMIADLVAREEQISSSDMTAIYEIVDIIMGDFDTSSLKIDVIPVMSNPLGNNEIKVYPRTTNRPSKPGGSEPAQCSTYKGIGSDVIGAGGTAIVVETSYTYRPVFYSYIMQQLEWTGEDLEWTARAVSAPRDVCVDFDGNNCAVTCF